MYVYDWWELNIALGKGRIASLEKAIEQRHPDVKEPSTFDYLVDSHVKRSKLYPPEHVLDNANADTDLCHPCRRIFAGTSDPSMKFKNDEGKGQFLDSYHHWAPFWLERSAANGCSLCALLWHRLRGSTIKLDDYEFLGGRCEILRYMRPETSKRIYPLIFHYLGISTTGANYEATEAFSVTIELEQVGEQQAAELPTILSPTTREGLESLQASGADNVSTSSSDAIDQLKSWLYSCANSHHCVQQPESESVRFLPERLLCVGTQDSPMLHLVERHKLSRSTSMLDCIPISDLPKTFIETVDVVRRLGIKYIWIDSLCIVQDSKADWERNAAEMWKVYSRSHLNISATASSDSRSGLFRNRNPASIMPSVVQVSDTHDHLHGGRYFFYDRMSFKDQVENASVNIRAWVVQERLLSSRIVHFSEGQLFWECRSLQSSERFPTGFPEGTRRTTERSNYQNTCGSDVTMGRFLHSWNAVVEVFTRCGMSYRSDTLPAIAALARHLQETTLLGGAYLAGLWEERLLDQLLWSPKDGCTRSESYRAPSWSWASMDGPIKPNFNCNSGPHCDFPYSTDYSKRIAKVIEARVESPTDSFLVVSSGRLVLQAPVWCVSLSRKDLDRYGADFSMGFLFSGERSDSGATMHLDESTNYSTLSQMTLVLAPILCCPELARGPGLERGFIDRIGCLILATKQPPLCPTSGFTEIDEKMVIFSRIGVANLDDAMFARVLCEIGNQEILEDKLHSRLGKSSERLKLEHCVPSGWYLKDLSFIPRDFATYEIHVE